MRFSSRTWLVLVNAAAILAGIGLVEIYLRYAPKGGPQIVGSYADSEAYFTRRHPDFGYVIKPGDRVVTSALKRPDGSAIYDVSYHIDRNGLRATQGGAGRPVYFLGDSFVFGQGVRDAETLPQQFADLTGMRAINFGVHGYGPHQVLRALEIDYPRKINPEDPRAIVYVLLPAPHMLRAAGRATWDIYGPHYEVIDGKVTYLGRFKPSTWWQEILEYSETFRQVLDWRYSQTIREPDRERLIAMIARMRDLAEERYRAPFLAVLWDVNRTGGSEAQWMKAKLRERKIETLVLSDVLPELQSDAYYLPDDWHPAAQAHVRVAAAVAAALGKLEKQ